MQISNSSASVVCAVGALIATLLLSPAMSDRAHAFGGLWSSQATPVEQSAEEVLFVDNADATVTAVVQIHYAGPPQKFAWVIPLPGKPVVGVSSNTVFQRLDAATAPQYWVEVAVEGTCKQPAENDRDAAVDAGADAGAAPSAADDAAAPVVVIDHGSVDSYDYVNITVDPTLRDPAKVATDWLTHNGYDLTTLDSQLLRPYLSDGLNLLAFKLAAGADAGAIRPVTLTYESKRPMIPITPAAVAAQDDMRIQVWVIGPSQAVPANYKSLVINDARIDWLSGGKFVAGTPPAGGVGPTTATLPKPSNYDAVVAAAAHEAGGQGFVTELGAPASQFRDKVWSTLDDDTFATVSSQSYTDGVEAILAANSRYAGWDGWKESIEGAIELPAGVTLDEFARDPDNYRGAVKVDVDEFFALLETHVIRPVADTAALLFNAPYLTRLYSSMSAAEMTLDPVFDYNVDLAQVSNVHIAKQFIACSATLNQADAPWRIELPQGGVVTGKGSARWPLADSSIAANLEVVMLSTSGSGTVVADNREDIGTKLWKLAGMHGASSAMLRPPQNGVMIGGTQSVTLPDATPHEMSSSMSSGAKNPSGGSKCSVSRVGRGNSSALAFGVSLATWILALRRRRRAWCMKRGAASVLACVLLAACSSDAGAPAQTDAGAALAPGALTREQLRDPQTCKGCHPNHYRQWSSSMHAYAAKDPVFIAMNKRGQRETHGELGDFCIKCHAPMAVLDKSTRDGLDLERLPDKDRGVSCYFCHNAAGIDGDHNAMLHVADDTTMRGPIHDPLQPGVHVAEFSELLEDRNPQSSALCGGCHDIVTSTGVHLERTLQEYRSGIFSKSATGEPPSFDSCVGCHMPGKQGLAAAVPGAGQRVVHEHLWPGIDVALIDHPHRDAQRSAVEDCQLGVASVSFFTLEVTPPDLFTFQIETNAGHNQPSGAAQDRRMWLEFSAYDKNGQLLEQVSSGNIADDQIEEQPEGDPQRDPHLLMFRDRIFDARGKPVHMFWQAAPSQAHPEGYESNVLPVATTTYIEGKHAVLKQYRASTPDGELPARVTARLKMRPIGLDVLQDLVDSGDLDSAIMAQMPTFTLGAQVEWTPADGLTKPISATTPKTDCNMYHCLLDPGAQGCE